MDKYGYSNVYAVNNYKHPFDLYFGEYVMLFDEFSSNSSVGSIRIQDMNNYLDGYPIALPARYNNKQACYKKVYIISNLDLREQYKQEQLLLREDRGNGRSLHLYSRRIRHSRPPLPRA